VERRCQNELGIYVCGGRAKHSRRTPAELAVLGDRIGVDAPALTGAGRLVAKVDSAAVQDGSDLYLHGFFVTADGQGTVVQQGMNGARRAERSQYTSIEFGKRCREAGVRPSMGSVGDAYDNAMAESFFATLECELLDRRRFRTLAEARMAVFEFIEGFYNPRRRHSSLGYLSPVEFERQQEEGALDPGTHHPAAVLGAVKVRPGDVAMAGEVSATADLDRPCARRLHVRAGRDEKMLSAEPKDAPRKQQKEDTLPPNPLP
jgi:hypothetical protein